jgi:hypothetical protein
MTGYVARIAPAVGVGTQGTTVWVGDHQLTGVTKIELVAEVNDVWRAVIHCAVIPDEVLAVAELRESAK